MESRELSVSVTVSLFAQLLRELGRPRALRTLCAHELVVPRSVDRAILIRVDLAE